MNKSHFGGLVIGLCMMILTFVPCSAQAATLIVAASDALDTTKADYVCDGTADEVQIQAAIDALYTLGVGGGSIKLTEGNYHLSSGLSFSSSGIRISGMGKSATTLNMGSDFCLFPITNKSDIEISNLLVVASTGQTNPVIKLNATTGVITRNNFKGLQVAGCSTANTFTVIELYTAVSCGIWNCHFDDIAVSSVGTVVELNSAGTDSWINYNYFNNFYLNDFVKGIDIIDGDGAGANSNRFSNWGAQCTSRTQFGLRIPDSSELYNCDTQLYAVDFVDMYLSTNGKYFDIGSGVVGTTIIGGTGIDKYNKDKFTDKGVGTQISTMDDHIAKLMAKGNFLVIPTQSGWTQGASGSGTTDQQISHSTVRTGSMANSSARLYTSSPLFGFSSTIFTCLDYTKEFVLIFNYARCASETNAVARVQLKNATTGGALTGAGLGIKVENFSLKGESYGTGDAEVDLNTTLNADQTVQIMIIFYPGERMEWWVDGKIKATQVVAGYLPQGSVVSYLVHSISSSGNTDAQSYLMQPKLWQEK